MKFTPLLKSLVLEQQSKFEILFDNLTKQKKNKKGQVMKPKLTETEFFELISADPTTRLNNVNLETASPEELKKVKVGKYSPWIIKHYLQPKLERSYGEVGYDEEVKQMKDRYLEDLYKITLDLQKFTRFKSRIEGERDLNKLTPEQLYDAVKDFSLEKTKASAEEKKEASITYEHPGADIVFRGNDWVVAKISRKDELGKDAACFYGGHHLEPSKGETTWCTSSPGLNYFKNYIKDGPLYVIIPKNWSGQRGIKSGLPAERYQFHFQSNQFKDTYDRELPNKNSPYFKGDLFEFLNTNPELKEFFKPEFSKNLVMSDSDKLVIDNFERGPVGKFIALYGLDDLFKSLPSDIKEMQISNRSKNDFKIKIPDDISKFKDLNMVLFENVIDSVPESICQLDNLRFLAFVNNKDLTTIPDCIGDMKNLLFLNYKGSTNLKIPEYVLTKGNDIGGGMVDFQSNIMDLEF